MAKALPTLIILIVLALVALLMFRGWRLRTRRDRPAGGGYPRPRGLGATRAKAGGFYVATTKSGQSLERLSLPGLRFRGRGALLASANGVLITVRGEDPVYIPSSALTGVGSARVTIDRVVERDGLMRLSWRTSGGVGADSYFRVEDPADRIPVMAAVEALVPVACQAGRPTESEV